MEFVSGDGAESSSKRVSSISRWLLLTTAVGTALAFGLLMWISSNSSYKNSIDQAAISHTVISELLATQVAGGLRWKKQRLSVRLYDHRLMQ
ncbi:MAG: hypothetical protein AB8B64_03115 [Granulosicoccus sp.]